MKRVLLFSMILSTLLFSQTKDEILNNLQRGGIIDMTDASPTSTYDVLVWDGDELKLVTITVLGTTFPSLSVAGDVVLKNNETVDNDTDGDIYLIYDDDAATLADIYIQSTVDTPNVATNDHMDLTFQFNDDSSGYTNWGQIIVTSTDIRDESEDSKIDFKTIAAATQTTSLSMTGSTLTLSNGETIDNATNGTINLTASAVKVTDGEINNARGYRYEGSSTITIDNEALTTDTLKLASTLYNIILVRNTVNGSDSVHAISGGLANTYYQFKAVHGDTTINFIDGGNLKLGGARALDSATDVLYCWYDGTNFIEVVFSNND